MQTCIDLYKTDTINILVKQSGLKMPFYIMGQ